MPQSGYFHFEIVCQTFNVPARLLERISGIGILGGMVFLQIGSLSVTVRAQWPNGIWIKFNAVGVVELKASNIILAAKQASWVCKPKPH